MAPVRRLKSYRKRVKKTFHRLLKMKYDSNRQLAHLNAKRYEIHSKICGYLDNFLNQFDDKDKSR